MNTVQRNTAGLILLSLPLCLLTGCKHLPSDRTWEQGSVLKNTQDTRLVRSTAPKLEEKAGLNAIYALGVSRQAFATRVLLANWAEKSLDVQYYIWHADTTGLLLMEQLQLAADRGVRVRLLLDDTNTKGMDPLLAALDAHPNIEIRLFNPFVNRKHRAWGYMTDFNRLNRRMHNKSFTADNQVTIVGGRNIGDEYFGAKDELEFADLDVMAAGPVVKEVSSAFDLYWNCAAVYPLETLTAKATEEDKQQLRQAIADVHRSETGRNYQESVRRAGLYKLFDDPEIPVIWAKAALLCDDPDKGLGKAKDEELLLNRLMRAHGNPARHLDIISPYFVPGKEGAKQLASKTEQGVRVRILTNSLAATDVGAVHAGYAKHRKYLLKHGVELYELKPDPRQAEAPRKENDSKGGGSKASLHAKTFGLDEERLFIGSFNLDLRSYKLNTEMGFVIESPAMAGELARKLDQVGGQSCYTLRLSPSGDLQWVEKTATGELIHDKEPNSGFLRRMSIGFMSLLPIDWLL